MMGLYLELLYAGSARRFRLFWVCLCLATFLGSPASALAQEESATPAAHAETNVILISLQCLRPDHLGVYGYERKTSRNIDALAAHSVVFENAISQANLTPVAQMSVLTSQYPRTNGMVAFEVSRDMVTEAILPEILKKYGYTTAAALSSPEFFMRYEPKSGTMVDPGDVFSRSFDYFGRTISGLGGQSVRRAPTHAFQWLKENKEKKFFLWIASGVIHMPYAAAVPAPYFSMYDPPDYIPFWKRLPELPWGAKGKGSPSYDVFSRVFNNRFYWNFSPVYQLTKEDVAYVNGRYDAGVYYTDRFIGQLMTLLESLDLSKRTLVVLHSIHGEDLGEQGNFFHYDVTDTVIKNALIVRFPKGEFQGKRVAQQVQGIDIMPTVLEYLDIPAPHQAEGSSLLPLLTGEKAEGVSEFAFIDRMPWWEYNLSKWYLDFQINDQKAKVSETEREKIAAYLQMLKESFEPLGYPPGDIAIRTNEWKLIVRKNSELLQKVSWQGFISGHGQEVAALELYDLKADPLETSNVAAAHPEVVAWLKEKLLAWDADIEARKAKYKEDDARLLIPYPQ